MPIFEAFVLTAPEIFGTEAAVTGAEALGAAELGTAALTAGEMAGLGAAVEGGAAAAAPGITQAQMAADAAAGGARPRALRQVAEPPAACGCPDRCDGGPVWHRASVL
ncbi:MAG: hypothetical protein WCG15_07435 [Actinomycetes bacterium]